jgi:DNA-binding transcriptional MerR regulator
VSVPVIPDKPAFKAGEVCEIAQIQPYVLRSWESEFPDLGLSKTPGGPRVYRRADVERVLRIRELVFTEGLTLAGVRRRFESEQPAPQDDLFTLVAEVEAAQAARARARSVTSEFAVQPVAESAAPVEAPAAPSAPPLDDAARAQISKLKLQMRSLLDMLDGSAGLGTPAPDAAARRRRR